METNSTATGGFWSKLGGVLQDKAIDLADSYATMKLGKDTEKTQLANQPTTAAPYVAPATVSAPNNTKLILWIGGGVAALVLILALFGRRRR